VLHHLCCIFVRSCVPALFDRLLCLAFAIGRRSIVDRSLARVHHRSAVEMMESNTARSGVWGRDAQRGGKWRRSIAHPSRALWISHPRCLAAACRRRCRSVFQRLTHRQCAQLTQRGEFDMHAPACVDRASKRHAGRVPRGAACGPEALRSSGTVTIHSALNRNDINRGCSYVYQTCVYGNDR
jgi:hypothetical protein